MQFGEVASHVKEASIRAGVLRGAVISDWKRVASSGERNAYREANDRLRNVEERLKFGGYGLGNMHREDIDSYCEKRAKRILEIIPEFPSHLSLDDTAALILGAARFDAHGLEWKKPKCDGQAYLSLFTLYKKVTTPDWWVNKLKTRQKRVIEEVARDFNLVNKRRGTYCSDLSLDLRKKQEKRNRKMLENVDAVNQYGEAFTLADLSDLSISNPEIRRAELMTRVAGFQMMAEQQNHAAVFWTITCPSKFHSHSTNGKRNGKYNGSTVRDAQAYLVRLWAGFRSWCNRNQVEFYGFRVAEPHHDGCPHWHILVFGERGKLVKATAELKARSLEDDGHEIGAKKNRFLSEWIHTGQAKDGRKLSAAGYIAKYIAKSVDGFSVGSDTSLDANGQRYETGQTSEEGAARVIAWARTHGIRQFQQVGGASVSVWRELRKLYGECDCEEAQLLIETVETELQTDAASAWAVFNFLNGSGRDQRLKLWRDDERPEWQNVVFLEDRLKENPKPLEWPIQKIKHEAFKIFGSKLRNQYGEVTSKIKGLVFDGVSKIKTRFFEWVIVKRDEIQGRGALVAAPPPLEFCQ